MKIRNRILAGLLSFTVVMGELLPAYAAGADTEYATEEALTANEEAAEDEAAAAEEPAVTEDALAGEDEEITDTEAADAAAGFVFKPGYIELPEDEEVTVLNTDKSYRELRGELVEGAAEEEYSYSAEADRASATDRAFPYSYTNTPQIEDYFETYFPAVRNQNPFGSCWAHSAMSLGEFYMATHGMLSDRTAVDFSELHMAHFCYTQGTPSIAGDTGDKVSFFSDSINEKLDAGGNLRFAAQTLAQGRGFADESVAPYPEYVSGVSYQDVPVTAPAASTERQDSAYLTCSYEISTEDVTQLKQAVIENGIVGVSIFWDDAYYNRTNNAYLCNKNSTNHAVCIVGWDDNFPASSFKTTASRNGAWLIRNSWNFYGEMDTLSSYCYFWLSYDDTSLSDIAWVYEVDTESYDNHYFYDSEPHGESAFGYGEGVTCYSANVYQAKGNQGGSELLEAVTFSAGGISSSGTDYEVQVYTGLTDGGDPSTGSLHEASVTGGTIYFNGYYTVKLKEAVPLEEGEYYAVVLKRTDGYSATVEGSTYMTNGFSATPGAQSGQSFYSTNARYWTDNRSNGRYNFVIGAYTTDISGSNDRSSLKVNPTSLALEEGKTGTVTATVKDRNGNIDSSASVTFTSSDTTVATVTVSGQQATVKALKSGTATITAKYGSKTASCQLTVRAKETPVPATIVLNYSVISFTSADQSTKLIATVRDTNFKVITDPELVYTSQDTGVATVDEEGVVRPVATGATGIIVKCGTVTASCTVAVALADMKTAAPVADPPDGIELPVSSGISLSCATPGAKIYYTIDGSTPTEASTLYRKEIVLPDNAVGTVVTVKAMAVAEGYTASDVAVFRYTVTEAFDPWTHTEIPTADPVSGSEIHVGESIELNCATEGALIYYTTDGSGPTEDSTLYTEAIVVPRSAFGSPFKIRAFAVAEGCVPSGEGDFVYTVLPSDKTTAPVADPISGTELAVGDTIDLSCTMSDAAIYYTLDGSDPDETSKLYLESIVVPDYVAGEEFTVRAIAVAPGYYASDVAVFSYAVSETIPVTRTAAPVADPRDGSYLVVGETISLSSATEGAKIYYTTDGLEVTKESALYDGPIKVEKEHAGKKLVIRAFASCEELEDSAPVSFVYTVKDHSAISLDKKSVRITSAEEHIRLKATVTGPDGLVDEEAEVVFESRNTAVVTVSKDGLLTAVSNGKTIVTASSGELSAQCEVTVRLPDPEETEPVYTLDFYVDEVLQSSVSVERGHFVDAEDIPAVEQLLCWFDREVGEVWDPASPITRDMGLYACLEGDKAAEQSALDTVPVRSGDSYYLVRGQSLDLSAEGMPVLTSDGNGAVKLSKKGVVTAKKAGKASIELSGEEYTLQVIEPAVCLNGWAVKSLSLTLGESQKLDVRRVGIDGKDLSEHYPVYWYSSAPAVVSVSGGEVYAIAKGSATVTAYVNGKGYSCKVKVADTKKISVYREDYDWNRIELSKVSLKPLQSHTLKLSGLSFKNREWESEDSDLRKENDGKKTVYENDVVRIDMNGKLTAIGPGSCTIFFTDEDDTEYALRVSVSQPQERRLYLYSGKSSTLKFYGVKNAAARFESSDNYVATVDAKGTVKAHGAGMATITCTYGNFDYVTYVYTEFAALDTSDGKMYQNGNQYSYKLRIQAGTTQRIRFRTEKGYGVYQPVLFKSNRNNIAFVNECGVIEARKAGEAVISAKVNGKKITIRVTVVP